MSDDTENTSTTMSILGIGAANKGKFFTGTPDSATANKLKNAAASAQAGKEIASMMLRGYPLLKAKATVEVTGVGKGSGVWYCKTVIQEWNVEHGYTTNVSMTKGSGGGGGGNNDPHGGEAVRGSQGG
jgi:phage protein D